MKENNNIDELFQEGLHQDFPYDESLWASFENQLPGSSGIPRRGLWIFNLNSFALLMVLCTCAFIPTDNVRTSVISHQNIEIDKVSQISNLEINSSKANEESFKGATISSENKEFTERAENNSDVVPQSKSTIDHAQPLVNSSAHTDKISNQNNNNASDAVARLISTSTSVKLVTEDGENEESIQSVSNPLIASINYNSSNIGTVLPTLSDLKLGLLSPLNFAEGSDNNTVSPIMVENSYTDLRNKSKKSFQYIEVEFLRSLSVNKTLNGKDETLISYKERNEKSRSVTNYGLNFVNQYKYLTYGMGLHYSKYTERVSYTLPEEAHGFNVSYDTNYRLVNNGFQSNGVPVYLIEEVINEVKTPVVRIVDGQLIATNTFKRIRVPVFVGLQKRVGNWQAELRTSLIMNYLVGQEGVYINNDLQSIQSISESDQLNQFLFSNKSDVSIAYSLFENVAVGTRFSYEQDINSFTKNYDSKLNSYQLGVWLMWRPY